MASLSSHFKLQELIPGVDNSNTNGGAFYLSNIDTIDSLFFYTFNHHHDGTSPSDNTPASALTASVSTTGGNVGPNQTIRYRYSLVDQYGVETTASPEVIVTTPLPVATPNPPSLSTVATGGTLLAGTYFYSVSAYVAVNNVETLCAPSISIPVPIGTSTNRITLTLPSLPSGASGFNIYRRAPGESSLFYMATVDMGGATPPTTFTDNGLMAENCSRYPSTSNRTNATNSVTLMIPGATPVVPTGYTWRVYRTFVTTYNNSLLASVVEETSSGSGIIKTTYVDTGGQTTSGSPKTASFTIPAFSKINLATESTGNVPTGRQIVPHVIYFSASGDLDTGPGDFTWVCPFDKAQVMETRANLGSTVPTSDNVIADIQHSVGATPVWSSIFTDTGRRPSVPVGNIIGSRTTTTSADHRVLVKGDTLRINLIQVDDSAQDLLVYVLLYVIDGSTTNVFTFDS